MAKNSDAEKGGHPAAHRVEALDARNAPKRMSAGFEAGFRSVSLTIDCALNHVELVTRLR